MDFKAFFNGLNDIIGYSGNREEFNNKFLQIIYDKALNVCIDKYKPEQKNQILDEFNMISDYQLLLNTVNKYFTQEQFTNELKVAAQNTMEDYLSTIDSELTDEQRDKIAQYFAANRPQA